MSGQKWTPEPWAVDIDEPYAIKTIEAEPWYVAKAEKFVNENGLPKDSERNANADRIVACVNGCEGLNPEAFAELAKSHTELLRIIEENRTVGLNQGSEYVHIVAAALSAELHTKQKVSA